MSKFKYAEMSYYPKNMMFNPFKSKDEVPSFNETGGPHAPEPEVTEPTIDPNPDPNFPASDGSVPPINDTEIDETDDVDVKEINKDFDCFCCGTRLINAAPKVVLTFIVSLVVIIFAFVYMFVKGDVVIFAPIVAGVVGFWLPSPVQSSQSRKDALQSSRLLQNNMRMNRLMVRYGIVDRRGQNYGTYRNV